MANKNDLTHPDNWVSVERLNEYYELDKKDRDALLDEKQGVFQFSEIPTATSGNLGAIIQYTGETTGDYTTGYFYRCVENDGSYSWENVPVQDSGSTDEYVKKSGDTMTGGLTTPNLTVFQRGSGNVGTGSVAEGFKNIASGNYSHAEGSGTTASGLISHAEGSGTYATNDYAHAEGNMTQAKNTAAHAEGAATVASGLDSHAEGMNARATAAAAHAEGNDTRAGYANQHVQGKYNSNKSTDAFEIGNGTSDTDRSNALEVTWGGDLTAAGEITDGSGNKLSEKQRILTAGENITINENGVISAAGGSSIEVDSALSSTSENPVQNKVINTALGNKRTTGSFDDANDTVTYTSNDAADDSSATSWLTVAKLTSGETLKSLFGKISSLANNIRWLKLKKRTTDAFDSKSDTVTFTTGDVSSDSSATSWTSVSQLTSGLSHATLLNRISTMMKNVRYLYNQLTASPITTASSIFSNYYNSFTINYVSLFKIGRIIILNVKATSSTTSYGFMRVAKLNNTYRPYADSYTSYYIGNAFNLSDYAVTNNCCIECASLSDSYLGLNKMTGNASGGIAMTVAYIKY